jgi:predicted transposase/invertase (TIGR01784 family)
MYVDAKNDIAFKKLFGNSAHKEILISFLNSVLEREEGTKIVDVTYIEPVNLPEIFDLKLSSVDVRCTDQSGKQCIVALQMVSKGHDAVFAQYYSALVFSRQLTQSWRYDLLIPVIFVGILNFECGFSNPSYITHHLLLNQLTRECDLNDLEFHFIELPKFNLQEDQLNTILEKWVYLLKNADIMQKWPELFQEPELDIALDLLAQD